MKNKNKAKGKRYRRSITYAAIAPMIGLTPAQLFYRLNGTRRGAGYVPVAAVENDKFLAAFKVLADEMLEPFGVTVILSETETLYPRHENNI